MIKLKQRLNALGYKVSRITSLAILALSILVGILVANLSSNWIIGILCGLGTYGSLGLISALIAVKIPQLWTWVDTNHE